MAGKEENKLLELKNSDRSITQAEFAKVVESHNSIPQLKGKVLFKDKRTGKYYAANSAKDVE